MIVIINIVEEYYQKIYKNEFFGKEIILQDGFIHASNIEQFSLIIPRLERQDKKFMVVFIDTDKLIPNIKWEYSESLKQDFPHIYGEINKSAVIKVISLNEYKKE